MRDTDQIDMRLDAMEQNIDWLREHRDADAEELNKRLGLLKGDLRALWYQLGQGETDG